MRWLPRGRLPARRAGSYARPSGAVMGQLPFAYLYGGLRGPARILEAVAHVPELAHKAVEGVCGCGCAQSEFEFERLDLVVVQATVRVGLGALVRRYIDLEGPHEAVDAPEE